MRAHFFMIIPKKLLVFRLPENASKKHGHLFKKFFEIPPIAPSLPCENILIIH